MSQYTGFLGAFAGWVLFLVLGGCCRPVVAVHPDAPLRDPVASLSFHVDVDFTQHERELIQRAARELHRQTGGQLVVTLKPDLDFSNKDQLPPPEDWYLIKLSSIGLIQRNGALVMYLGITYPNRRELFLIYDRLGADEQFLHTTMHEMLHAFGVSPPPTDHVEGGALLGSPAWWDDPRDAPLCMNRLDALAISKALNLDPTAFSLACPTKLR